MNPCPSGYYGDHLRACTCSETMVSRYQKRLSGPLLDRIARHVEVPRVEYEKLAGDRVGERSGARQKKTACMLHRGRPTRTRYLSRCGNNERVDADDLLRQ